MNGEEIRAQLLIAWAKVYSDYLAGRIHNETDMAISFAKHLATDARPVISEALVKLELIGTPNVQKHPDLIWAANVGARPDREHARSATALAIIELKYDYAPNAFIDTKKMALMQQESGEPFAEAGFRWSRTWTQIHRNDETVYVMASIGQDDALACRADFKDSIVSKIGMDPEEHPPLPRGLLILQIAEPVKGADAASCHSLTLAPDLPVPIP